MSNNIAYSVNRSNVAEIVSHLLHADISFEPALSSRVDIQSYAQKLNHHAVRFEAWLGQELVGLVASYCNQPDGCKAFVTNVSVLPEYHGQGIAGRLMLQCIEHVRCLGFCQIELEVDQRSLSAVALYQKLGFNTKLHSGVTMTMGMAF